MKTLFIGDIVGRKARNLAIEKIKEFKESKLFDLIIVNVENSAGGFGVTPEINALSTFIILFSFTIVFISQRAVKGKLLI